MKWSLSVTSLALPKRSVRPALSESDNCRRHSMSPNSHGFLSDRTGQLTQHRAEYAGVDIPEQRHKTTLSRARSLAVEIAFAWS